MPSFHLNPPQASQIKVALLPNVSSPVHNVETSVHLARRTPAMREFPAAELSAFMMPIPGLGSAFSGRRYFLLNPQVREVRAIEPVSEVQDNNDIRIMGAPANRIMLFDSNLSQRNAVLITIFVLTNTSETSSIAVSDSVDRRHPVPSGAGHGSVGVRCRRGASQYTGAVGLTGPVPATQHPVVDEAGGWVGSGPAQGHGSSGFVVNSREAGGSGQRAAAGTKI